MGNVRCVESRGKVEKTRECIDCRCVDAPVRNLLLIASTSELSSAVPDPLAAAPPSISKLKFMPGFASKSISSSRPSSLATVRGGSASSVLRKKAAPVAVGAVGGLKVGFGFCAWPAGMKSGALIASGLRGDVWGTEGAKTIALADKVVMLGRGVPPAPVPVPPVSIAGGMVCLPPPPPGPAIGLIRGLPPSPELGPRRGIPPPTPLGWDKLAPEALAEWAYSRCSCSCSLANICSLAFMCRCSK